MISTSYWYLNWIPRLTTSIKLLLTDFTKECGQTHSFYVRGVLMATKAEKKEVLRQDIIMSAQTYSNTLAGRNFLYVYGNEYFEVSFPTDCFLHLTGVETYLSAKDFYKISKKGILTNSQFYFSSRFPFANAQKKLPCLKRLPELTNDFVCILKDMQTIKLTYKLSVTNLEFTLGLTESIDKNANRIDNLFLPMSLRVEESSVKRSADGEIVDFIFSKDASVAKYDVLLVKDERKIIPECVRQLLNDTLLKQYA